MDSRFSNVDLATKLLFTDSTLVKQVTLIRGIHVDELRQAIDSVRKTAGLQAFWTSYAPASGIIYASDFQTMRQKLEEARSWLYSAHAIPTMNFGETVSPGITAKTEHVQNLRNGVQ